MEPVLLTLGPLPWVGRSLFLASLLPLAAWGETFCHVRYSGPGKRGILDTSGFLACRNVEGSDSLGLGLKKPEMVTINLPPGPTWKQLSWALVQPQPRGGSLGPGSGPVPGAH